MLLASGKRVASCSGPRPWSVLGSSLPHPTSASPVNFTSKYIWDWKLFIPHLASYSGRLTSLLFRPCPCLFSSQHPGTGGGGACPSPCSPSLRVRTPGLAVDTQGPPDPFCPVHPSQPHVLPHRLGTLCTSCSLVKPLFSSAPRLPHVTKKRQPCSPLPCHASPRQHLPYPVYVLICFVCLSPPPDVGSLRRKTCACFGHLCSPAQPSTLQALIPVA